MSTLDILIIAVMITITATLFMLAEYKIEKLRDRRVQQVSCCKVIETSCKGVL